MDNDRTATLVGFVEKVFWDILRRPCEARTSIYRFGKAVRVPLVIGCRSNCPDSATTLYDCHARRGNFR